MTEEEPDNWRNEAEGVIKDIQEHVKEVSVSDSLEKNNRKIYLNVTTLEDKKYCLELSCHGFRIVGQDYDLINIEDNPFFETPYSLLNSISPSFQQSFNNSLLSKLGSLANENV